MSQVWCGKEDLFFGGLIALTGDTLAVADPDENELADLRERLMAHEAPVAVLGSKAEIIPLGAIKKISTDKHDEDIEVEYAKGASNETTTLRLANPEKRDQVYAALRRHFHDQFNEHVESYSAPRAAFAPLMTLTVCAALTWVFAEAAADFKSGSADPYEQTEWLKVVVAWFLKLFGPTGVYVVGGALCALCVATLVMRIKSPPTILILKAGRHRPGTKLGLAFKYLLLFGAWTFVARVAWVA